MTRDELNAFHEGDNAVFTAVLADVKPALRRQIADFVHADQGAADDIYSEVCERIFERRREFRGEGPIGAWVSHICRSICADHARATARAKRRAMFDTPPSIAVDARSDEERARDAERRDAKVDAIINAVHTLPNRMRGMFLDSMYFNHGAETIAEIFHVKIPTVWTTLAKGRATLRPMLEPLMRRRSETPV